MRLTDDIIEDYLDGRLPAQDRARLEAQLKGSPKDKALVDEIRRLKAMLSLSRPEVPSERMWKGIQAKLAQPQALIHEDPLWRRQQDSFTRPQRWMAAGVAAACLMLAINLYQVKSPDTQELSSQAPGDAAQAQPAAVPKPEAGRGFAEEMPMAGKASRKKEQVQDEDLASAPSRAESSGQAAPRLTEVERALADQELDGMIASLLAQQEAINRRRAQAAAEPVADLALSRAPSRRAFTRSDDGGGASAVAYAAPAAPSAAGPAEAEAFDSRELSQPLSRVDANGFWDFEPAARALNLRDWQAAAREFQAASSRAPEAAERSFAGSALQLLSLPGQPLENSSFARPASGLHVQSAGRWQYIARNRIALYSDGVVARMPGLRSEGSSMQLDLTFDRASFSPGTRFVRLAGDKQAEVSGAAAADNSFSAPRGADYLLRAEELRLK